MSSVSHDCDYECIDRPGQPVVPLIIRPTLWHRPPSRGPQRLQTMEPGQLYQCVRCGVYVYVTQQYGLLRLREDAEAR